MPKILIADDSIAVRKVAERLLTEAGMGVTLAANGSEALALASKDRPDLIVSDVIMPDKSGYEVCAFIRAQANLADIPVLLISGIVNDEVSRQAESCKADGVLKKPFQGSSLKDRVLDLLGKRPQKPAPVPESPHHQTGAEPSIMDACAAAPIVDGSNHAQLSSLEVEEDRQPPEPVTIRFQTLQPIASAMTGEVLVKAVPVDQGAESVASTHAEDRHLAIVAQRDARITELEAHLEDERRRSHEQMQKIQQIQQALDQQHEQFAALTSQAQALDQSLVEERAQRASLAEQLAEVSNQLQRIGDLETELTDERRRTEELSQQVAEGDRQAARIMELEAHLAAERGAANQLVQQISALEHVEGRARELETALDAVREEAERYRMAGVESEKVAAKVPLLEEAFDKARARITELDETLTAEREASAALLAQIKQLEETAQHARELELALAGEQERSMQLEKRASEAEHLAEQSNRRFEDMARKLGEIAGLASQLGNGKR